MTTVLWLCTGTGTSSHLFSNSYKNNKMHVKTEKVHVQAHVVSNRSSMSTLVIVQECFCTGFFQIFFFFLMLLPIDYKQCHALTLKCPVRAHIWNSSQLVELCWRAVKSFRGGDEKVPRGRTLEGMAQARPLSAAIGTTTTSHSWHHGVRAEWPCLPHYGRLRSSENMS